MGVMSSIPTMPNIPVNAAATSAPETKSVASDASEEAVNSYLDEKRGRIGTVNTSWRGLLDKDEKLPTRKTLLGE